MSDPDEIQICEPAPFIYYENGQLAVTDGSSVWLVIVTCEAINATASPPEMSLRRLVRFAPFYRDLAGAAIHRGEDVDGKIWVTEAMVLSSRPVPPHQTAQGSRGHRARHPDPWEAGHAHHGS